MAELTAAGIDAIHFDLCDGLFAPTLLLPTALLKAARPTTTCRFDAHLYCMHPSRLLDELVISGADVVIVHWEAAEEAAEAVRRIRNAGLRAGIGLLPGTPVPALLQELLPALTIVITNMVGPAFAGQPFDARGLENARTVAAMARSMGHSLEIAADGSVSAERLPLLRDAGCNHLICGTSSLFRPGKPIGESLIAFRQAVAQA